MATDMRLPTIRKPVSLSVPAFDRKDLVVPGDVITSDTGFMRYVLVGSPGAVGGCCLWWSPRVVRDGNQLKGAG